MLEILRKHLAGGSSWQEKHNHMTKNKEKVVVLGAAGMLGTRLSWFLSDAYDVLSLGHDGCDITDEKSIVKTVAGANWVINCAAYTNVNLAEGAGKTDCWNINCTGAGIVARVCGQKGAKLIHISTDYVFANPGFYSEVPTPKVRALNEYGESKRRGEEEVLSAYSEAIIARVSATYGAGRKNFVDWVVGELKQDKAVKAVTGETTSPTCVNDIAGAIWDLIHFQKNPKGIYHLTNTGYCTRYDQALKIAEIIKVDKGLVHPVDSFPRPVQINPISVLVNNRVNMLPWQGALRLYLESKQ